MVRELREYPVVFTVKKSILRNKTVKSPPSTFSTSDSHLQKIQLRTALYECLALSLMPSFQILKIKLLYKILKV